MPDTFKNLMLGTSAEAKYFQIHIYMFNSGMAMASLQVPHNATVYKGQCSASRILGQLYRRIGLIRNQDENLRCLQTYFYDVEMQAKIRAGRLNLKKNPTG